MNNPRILIVKLSSLGDIFHALPLVHRLRSEWDATIDWVTQPEYADLVSRFTDVDRVIGFPRRNFWRGVVGYRATARRDQYALGIDLQGLMKSALALRLARASRVVGMAAAREAPRVLYHDVAPVREGSTHAVDRILDVAAHLGLGGGEAIFGIETRPATAPGDSPRICVIPCSRWDAKNWPPSRFVEVIRQAQKMVSASWFLAGGPDDAAACDTIAAACPEVTSTCGSLALPGLCDLLASMDLVLSVDSGPMHAAAALGVPVVAVFGPTDPARVGPYGPGHRVIQSKASRAEAVEQGNWKTVSPSFMMDIEVDEVCDAMLAALSAGRPNAGIQQGGQS